MPESASKQIKFEPCVSQSWKYFKKILSHAARRTPKPHDYSTIKDKYRDWPENTLQGMKKNVLYYKVNLQI